MSPWLLLLALLILSSGDHFAFVGLNGWAPPAGAQAAHDPDASASGTIAGRIMDAEQRAVLANANIIVAGTGYGTFSLGDGSFMIPNVPVGRYAVVITHVGYAPAERVVELGAEETVRVDVHLSPQPAAVLPPIEVRATRPVIDVTKTSTSHSFSAHDLEAMVTEAPTLDQVVAQQPGVIVDRGKIHVRGGRDDENLFVLDGVKVKDLLSGESMGSEVASRAAQQVDISTGGFGAQYSQAMSGVIATRLKEGTQRWHGAFSYETDTGLGVRDLHHVYMELSGPNLLAGSLLRLAGVDRPEVTFYTSLSTDLDNGYLPSIRDMAGDRRLRSSIRDQVLGQEFTYGEFFYPNSTNNWRLVFKTAWKINRNNKLSLSWTKTLGFQQDWGGADIGDINRNVSNYPWAWAQHFDHHYTISRDVNIFSLQWHRSLGLNTVANVRLWRYYSGTHRDVAGQHYSRYSDLTDADIETEPPEDDIDTPFFRDLGDAPLWRDNHSIVYGLANDWETQAGRHDLTWGLSAEYQIVQYLSLDALSVSPDLELGREFDMFKVTPNVGNLYLQDRIDYEGLTAQLGLVYDYWVPGQQVQKALDEGSQPHMTRELRDKFYSETHAFLGQRYKGHLSPRVGVSFPISDRAHLFFAYGHYSQRPPYYYVYAKSNSRSSEEFPRIGNPTLNPQISVQYEIGTGYQFTEETAAKATLFWKDQYDYPTSIRLTMGDRRTTRSNFFIYWNADYARSRGIELSLLRKRKNFLSGALSYTYSIGKGKSSDPNKTKLVQELGGDSRETDLGEEFLWWNRPHKLTAQASLRIRQHEDPPTWLGFTWTPDLQMNLFFTLRSGRAYTPYDLLGNQTADPFSRNGPLEMTCDFSMRKGFRVGGKRIEASFSIFNVFDRQTVLEFDPVTGKAYKIGEGSLWRVTDNPENYYLSDEELVAAYNKETGQSYGPDAAAALRQSILGRFYQYSNPANLGAPRAFRMGISYEW